MYIYICPASGSIEPRNSMHFLMQILNEHLRFFRFSDGNDGYSKSSQNRGWTDHENLGDSPWDSVKNHQRFLEIHQGAYMGIRVEDGES